MELEAMRQQLAEAKRQADEERHARERDAQQAAFRQQQIEAERKHTEEMRELRAAVTAAASVKKINPADDPILQQMKAQNEALQRRLEETERRNEQAAAEARHREEMKTLQETMQRQQDQTKELIAKMAEGNKGPDPQMTMLIEMQRAANDDRREQARVQSELQREAARQATEAPRQMVDMMERLRSAGGMEQVLASISGSYAGLMEQQKGVLEMVMNMGPDPKMALAEGALAGGKEILEQFMMSKRDTSLAAQRTEQMKAQERATAAQAQAQVAYATQVASQAPYRDENGNIAGQPPQRDQLAGEAEVEAELIEEGTESETGSEQPDVVTEEEVFGPAWENVLQLREAVENGEVKPNMVATFLVQAVMEIQKNDLTVPAFSLIVDQRYADLMDLLLPTAPSEFVGECVTEFIKRLREVGLDPGNPHVDLDGPSNGALAQA